MFYAAKNRYATDNNVGFYNTWYIVGFQSKTERDSHVKSAVDLATRSIKVQDFKKYVGKTRINFVRSLDEDAQYVVSV